MARNVMIGVAVVLLGIGGVWIGQGLGFLPGSFMTGVKMWFWIGVVVALVGLALLVGALRRGGPTRRA